MSRTPINASGCHVLAILAACFLCGCQRGASEHHTDDSEVSTQSVQHAVVIRKPPMPRGVMTDTLDAHGQPVTLQCFSCHSLRAPNASLSRSADLDEFHKGLNIAHGQLTCGSCHNAQDNYSSLKLADGRPVSFEDSMTLCAQCHGPQFRDYLHGSHGGMTGHWDLTRGGRERNHCLHCHDQHSPKYPQFAPVAGPRDRFQPVQAKGASHE